MAVITDNLKVVVIVATVIGKRDDVIYLCSWCKSSVAMACLTQSAIALEYPLSDGHPSAATYALGHLFSSQPLRIYRLSAVRYVLRCWVTTFRECECKRPAILVRWRA